MFKWQTIVVLLLLGIINELQLVQCEETPSTQFEMKTAAGHESFEFALKLYQQLRNDTENIFLSPPIIAATMGIVSLGACEDTYRQIKAAMALNQFKDDNKLHETLGHLSTAISSDRVNTNIYSNYELVVDQSLDRNSFTTALSNFYNVTVSREDVSNNLFLDSSQNTRGTPMMMTSSVYFESQWIPAVQSLNAVKQKFKTTRHKTVNIDGLGFRHHTKTAEIEKLNAIAYWLPFAEDDLSMVILYPKNWKELDLMENALSGDLPRLLRESNAMYRDLYIYLPKFQLGVSNDLTNSLRSIGVKDAFTSTADFCAFTNDSLYISRLLHHAKMQLNTTVLNHSRPDIATPAIERLDHPFVFLIFDEKMDSILFLGRVGNPTRSF